MATLTAAIETYFAFVGGPELAKPPERGVVLALGAFGGDGGEGRDRGVLDNGNSAFRCLSGSPQQVLVFCGLDITTLAAFHLPTG